MRRPPRPQSTFLQVSCASRCLQSFVTPLLTASCCHVGFVEPNIPLSTFPPFILLRPDFRCPRSFITALLLIIVSIRRRRRCKVLAHPPSFHLLINYSLFVWALSAPKSTCTISECVSLQMVSQQRTSWYFFKSYNSVPWMRFKSVGAENHNKHHCTTHGTSNLKSSAMLIISSSCWINVLDVTHSCSTNAPAQTHFVQSIMDITVWKTLTWETHHRFLTMYFWVAL